MPAAIVPLLIGSIAVDVVGKVKAGKAAKQAGDYNAQVADTLAQDAIDRGRQEEQTYRQGVRTLMGSQRTDFAAQNVEVDSGTPLNVRADTAYLGELDAQQIRTNAQREAWGYKVQANQSRTQGNAQANANYYGAAGSALGGTASLLQAKYGWGKK